MLQFALKKKVYTNILTLPSLVSHIQLLRVYTWTRLPNRLVSILNLQRGQRANRQQNSHAAQMKRQTAAQIRPLVCTKWEVYPSIIIKNKTDFHCESPPLVKMWWNGVGGIQYANLRMLNRAVDACPCRSLLPFSSLASVQRRGLGWFTRIGVCGLRDYPTQTLSRGKSILRLRIFKTL